MAARRLPERQNVSDKRQFLRLAAGVVLTAGVPCCVGAACDCGLTKGVTSVVFVNTHPSQTLLAALCICCMLSLLSLEAELDLYPRPCRLFICCGVFSAEHCCAMNWQATN